MGATGPTRADIADHAPAGGPQKVGVAVADLCTGMDDGAALLAALRHRDRTDEGQAIDMALLDTQVTRLANVGGGYLASGVVPGRAGTALQAIVPDRVFEVANGHVIVAVGNERQFEPFCAVAGLDGLPRDRASPAAPRGATPWDAAGGGNATRPRDDWLRAPRWKAPAAAISDVARRSRIPGRWRAA